MSATNQPVPFEVHETGVFLHGTKADLAADEVLVPGRESNFEEGRVMNHVYFTATLDAATWGAELAAGEGRGRIVANWCPSRGKSVHRLWQRCGEPPRRLMSRTAHGPETVGGSPLLGLTSFVQCPRLSNFPDTAVPSRVGIAGRDDIRD